MIRNVKIEKNLGGEGVSSLHAAFYVTKSEYHRSVLLRDMGEILHEYQETVCEILTVKNFGKT